MGVIVDILKEVPLSAVLKERLTQLEREMADMKVSLKEKDSHIAKLQLALEKAQAEIQKFKKKPQMIIIPPRRRMDVLGREH